LELAFPAAVSDSEEDESDEESESELEDESLSELLDEDEEDSFLAGTLAFLALGLSSSELESELRSEELDSAFRFTPATFFGAGAGAGAAGSSSSSSASLSELDELEEEGDDERVDLGLAASFISTSESESLESLELLESASLLSLELPELLLLESLEELEGLEEPLLEEDLVVVVAVVESFLLTLYSQHSNTSSSDGAFSKSSLFFLPSSFLNASLAPE
jgi:hypothetical protein